MVMRMQWTTSLVGNRREPASTRPVDTEELVNHSNISKRIISVRVVLNFKTVCKVKQPNRFVKKITTTKMISFLE